MIYVDGLSGHFPMNNHEILNNFVRFGIYILIESCVFKYLICLENINIGHLKISRDYVWPPEFSERKWTIYLLYFCVHFRILYYFVKIVVL